MFELAKKFRFDAAHTLQRRIETESSRRVHGHSYVAEVTIRGERDPVGGMVLDLGLFEAALAGARQSLDHHFLDDIAELGPTTIENLCVWIWNCVAPSCPGLYCVTVLRESNDASCRYYGPNPL